jgi:hypothetical protein
MTITAENQIVIFTHKWQGIASSAIGVASVIITLLLVGIVVSGTKPPKSVDTALMVLSSGMLCANLIGIALGYFGAKDRSSRKLYPRLGLTLNVAIPMAYLASALVGLAMTAP